MSMLSGDSTSTINKELGYRYYIYLPEDYDNTVKEWPLILFLHGMGERGDNLELVKKTGLIRYVEDGANPPFIIATPQCPTNQWWNTDNLMALLDHIQGTFRVDHDRVYLTGLSMGGAGTWALANSYPERFAAIAPICGFFTPGDPGRFKDLPIWCFHGAMDNSVPLSDSLRMVAWIREHGGTVRFTVYPDAAHNCWTETYHNPDLYQWFLEHKKRPQMT